MIFYFSGTGNCLAIAQRIAEATGDKVMSLYDGANTDLTDEKTIGFVYPSYYFNAPKPVPALIEQLRLPHSAYTFIVIPCGAQAGNSIWTISRILNHKGTKVDYSNKIRVPDCSAIGFGRNPNDQVWKFKRFASRLDNIIADIQAKRHAHHYGWWGPSGWLCARPSIERQTLPLLQPVVNKDKCTACNTCIRLCPQSNIKLVQRPDEKAKEVSATSQTAFIGDRCVQCLSCVHFCPQQAIEIAGKPTAKERQYHHPQIKLKDLLRK